MKSLVLLLSIALLGLEAQADQWKTGSMSKNFPSYVFEASYPVFNATSIPAYKQVNDQIKSDIDGSGCDEDGGDPGDPSMDYSVRARPVSVNQKYTTVEFVWSGYCGGAHPENGTYFLTFDSQAGKRLDIGREFGFENDGDWKKHEYLRGQIAEVLADHMPKDVRENCFDQMTRKETLEWLNDFNPVVYGLAKGKTVILGTAPEHYAAPCEFQIRVPYATIKHLLIPGSYLNGWLQ